MKRFLTFHLLYARIWEIVSLCTFLSNTAWANYSLDYALSGIGTTSSASQSYQIESGWGLPQSLDSTADTYDVSGEIEAFLDFFFDLQDTEMLLSNGIDRGKGWMQNDWFGLYFNSSFPWVYHENLGWSYIKQNSSKYTWIYRENLGWIWTGPDSFPHCYMNEREEWTFLDRSRYRATLYDYRYEEWFELDKIYTIQTEHFPRAGGKILGQGKYKRWAPVIIQAVPSANYRFDGWVGGADGLAESFEFEAVSDVFLGAEFFPVLPTTSTGEKLAPAIGKFIEDRNDLTTEEKSQAFMELLTTGVSFTAGWSIDREKPIDFTFDSSFSVESQIAYVREYLDKDSTLSEGEKETILAELFMDGFSESGGIRIGRE